MCEYTQVEFLCGHLRHIVRAWCTDYQQTHRRCPVRIVACDSLLRECEECALLDIYFCIWYTDIHEVTRKPHIQYRITSCGKIYDKNDNTPELNDLIRITVSQVRHSGDPDRQQVRITTGDGDWIPGVRFVEACKDQKWQCRGHSLISACDYLRSRLEFLNLSPPQEQNSQPSMYKQDLKKEASEKEMKMVW